MKKIRFDKNIFLEVLFYLMVASTLYCSVMLTLLAKEQNQIQRNFITVVENLQEERELNSITRKISNQIMLKTITLEADIETIKNRIYEK